MKILSMDSAKNRGRRKFLKCFRPIPADDERDFGTAFPPTSHDESDLRRKKRAHGSVSGALKAALNKASLVKKFRGKSSRKDSDRSKNDLLSKLEEPFHSMKKSLSHKKLSDQEEIFRSDSNSSSLFSLSSPPSRSSSTSSDSRSGSKRIIVRSPSLDFKQQSNTKRDCLKCICKPTTKGMCVFFVSLVALVFWGKFFAIMACTSTWFFFSPGQRRESPVSQLVDSAETKKRVVMEGFLERNRSRVL